MACLSLDSHCCNAVAKSTEGVAVNNIDRWLNDMIDKGLASISSGWIERAVEQKNDRMTVDLAHSIPLIYSNWDRTILWMQTFN